MKNKALRIQSRVLGRLGFFSTSGRGEALRMRVFSCALAFKLTIFFSDL